MIACIVEEYKHPGVKRLKEKLDRAAAPTPPEAPKENNSGPTVKKRPRKPKKTVRLEFDTLSPQDKDALDLLGLIIAEKAIELGKKSVALGKGRLVKEELFRPKNNQTKK